jgi:putative endonuclease
MTTKKAFGDYGETLAVRYLEQNGYVIVDTNWHCRYGEIDIVARLDTIWAFIEVKTRRGNKTDNAFSGITPQKQQKFIKAVQMYRSEHNLDENTWRIDAIAIAVPQNGTPIIEHVEDAFDW